MMQSFEFTIVASGLDHEADDFEDRFFAAGCDDATIAFSRGAILLHFARTADNLEAAIESALRDVEASGANADRVEPDYLVSLSEIAERAGMTRQAISNYATGKRAGGFPHPVARVTTDSPLWDWTDVAGWLSSHGRMTPSQVHEAHVLRRANAGLESLHHRQP